MSDEIFISAIFENPAIWNKKLPAFKDPVEKAKAWRNITLKMNIDQKRAIRRYKTLREYYRREKHKTHFNYHRDMQSGDNSGEMKLSQKEHLCQMMSFLDDVMTERKSQKIYRSSDNIADDVKVNVQQQQQPIKLEMSDTLDTLDPPCSMSMSETPSIICSTAQVEANISQMQTMTTPTVKVEEKIVDSLLQLTHIMGQTRKDKIASFCNYLEEELREMPPEKCNATIDELILVMMKYKKH